MKILTNLDLLKNELQNAVLQPLAIAPSSPKQGQFYYNSSDNFVYIYNGSAWTPVGVVYNQESNTGIVITGLSNTGGVTTTNVVNLTLTGYNPVESGYVTAGMTFQQALAALDEAVKNAVAGGGEVNQNAWSYIQIPVQSTNSTEEVDGVKSPVTVSATTKTDTFTIASGDQWIIVNGTDASKVITLGHKFSGVTNGQYGTTTSIPQINVDIAGHITSVSNVEIVGAQYITGLTSDAQEQLNSKIPSSEKGAPNGVATLGEDGLVPSAQLPSYVDDVVEAYIVGETPLQSDWLSTSQSGPALTPETGKIYVIISEGEYQNQQYRWGGTVYVLCNPSDVNSVNGKTGIVTLTQDDIGPGSTYTQFAITDKSKLDGIASGATANTITLNGSENPTPTFYAPVDSGTQNQILVSNGNNHAPIWQNAPEAFHKYTAQNTELVASGGSWTWTIDSSTHGISNNSMLIQVYEVSTGALVFTDVSVNQGNYTVTIVINDVNNIGTLTANTYQVVIIG